MNKAKVIAELQKEFPGRQIFCIPQDSDNPTEIICPLNNIEGGSRAIAVVDQTAPKFHKVSTEIFTVLKGQLIIQTEQVNSNGNRESQAKILSTGESFAVKPLTIYSLQGRGEEVWLQADTFPAWTPEDDFPAM